MERELIPGTDEEKAHTLVRRSLDIVLKLASLDDPLNDPGRRVVYVDDEDAPDLGDYGVCCPLCTGDDHRGHASDCPWVMAREAVRVLRP